MRNRYEEDWPGEERLGCVGQAWFLAALVIILFVAEDPLGDGGNGLVKPTIVPTPTPIVEVETPTPFPDYPDRNH